MFKRFITPLVAGAVALTLYAAPVQAGPGEDRQQGLDTYQTWQHDSVTSRKAWKRNGELRKSKRRGERGQFRKGKKRDRWQQAQVNRKARRANGGAVRSADVGGHPGSFTQILSGYDLPDYVGGYNQPPDNGSGGLTRILNEYDLPDYIGGYNQPLNNGGASIRDYIGDVNVYQ
ncbi:hypothetical protein EI983_05830 [Roseovarius faecimaris]|uniref:Uncharacterized protein n=1 Tax=Roseovarius faecimaris TaxID=2494550 RepID=A0A6I6IYX1_9RHOB|nr:hypothetical protein [Roseovarius faecimaris]QGX97818.1 hypothetical protein EI983_05830 [Roseovarius faecimaris]